MFDDRLSIESIRGRSNRFRVNGRVYRIKPLTFGNYIDLYLGIKYLERSKIMAGRIGKRSFWSAMKRIKVVRRNYSKSMRLLKPIIGKVRQGDLIPLLHLIRQYNFNPFHRPRAQETGSIYDETWECWIYNIIDLLAANYGWSLDEILSVKYQAIYELMAAINNRNVGNVMDGIMESVSGHAGSKETIDIVRSRIMKRKNVYIDINVLRDADLKAKNKLFGRMVA